MFPQRISTVMHLRAAGPMGAAGDTPLVVRPAGGHAGGGGSAGRPMRLRQVAEARRPCPSRRRGPLSSGPCPRSAGAAGRCGGLSNAAARVGERSSASPWRRSVARNSSLVGAQAARWSYGPTRTHHLQHLRAVLPVAAESRSAPRRARLRASALELGSSGGGVPVPRVLGDRTRFGGTGALRASRAGECC